ncbi:MAG: hypothetical protein AAGC55_10425, partial [Myxococcota bacterium]
TWFASLGPHSEGWIEEQTLTATTPTSMLGQAVAVRGTTAAVGSAGAVHIFERVGAEWQETQAVTASSGSPLDRFGTYVALDPMAETLVVGAPGDGDNGSIAGAAYVFIRTAEGWLEQGKLLASDGQSGDEFGISAQVIGDVIFVGAFRGDLTGMDAGAVYAFERRDGSWSEIQIITPTDPTPFHNFGISVTVDSGDPLVGGAPDTVIIGAQHDNSNGGYAGAAYVFGRVDDGPGESRQWVEQSKLLASDGAVDDHFATSIALSGERVLVGARYHDLLGNNAGTAYVLVRGDGGVWTEEAKLLPSDGLAGDLFAMDVALSGDIAVLGSRGHDTDNGFNAGSVYVFTRGDDGWTEAERLDADAGSGGDLFGDAVAISGGVIAIGAPMRDSAPPDPVADRGVAYIFALPRAADGAPCTVVEQCDSGYCVDGVCCDSACGDGVDDDCQGCSIAAGAALDGVCAPLAAMSECRPASGECDVAEYCDGVATICPDDALAADGSSCDDGDACTEEDSCQAGQCQPGAMMCEPEPGPGASDPDDPDASSPGGCAVHTGRVAAGGPAGVLLWLLSLMAMGWAVRSRTRRRR